jgi:hypothetical protein
MAKQLKENVHVLINYISQQRNKLASPIANALEPFYSSLFSSLQLCVETADVRFFHPLLEQVSAHPLCGNVILIVFLIPFFLAFAV